VDKIPLLVWLPVLQLSIKEKTTVHCKEEWRPMARRRVQKLGVFLDRALVLLDLLGVLPIQLAGWVI